MVIYTREKKTLIIPEGLGNGCQKGYDEGYEEGYRKGLMSANTIHTAALVFECPAEDRLMISSAARALYVNGEQVNIQSPAGQGPSGDNTKWLDFVTLESFPINGGVIEVELFSAVTPIVPEDGEISLSVNSIPFTIESFSFNENSHIWTFNVEGADIEEFIDGYYYLGLGIKDAIRSGAETLHATANGEYHMVEEGGIYNPAGPVGFLPALPWTEPVSYPHYFSTADVRVPGSSNLNLRARMHIRFTDNTSIPEPANGFYLFQGLPLDEIMVSIQYTSPGTPVSKTLRELIDSGEIIPAGTWITSANLIKSGTYTSQLVSSAFSNPVMNIPNAEFNEGYPIVEWVK